MIEIKQLTKKFASVPVVDHVSFQVVPGEVLGFLGPNGAGKSTTMKMITGFLAPTSGQVTVFDQDVIKHGIEAKKLIGYLPEGAPSYGEMTVLHYLKFIGRVRGFRGAELQRRVSEMMDLINIGDVANQKIATLSKGYKRRVGLAQAMLHDPKVLILDEPTDGLDPNQKQQVRTLIRDLSKDKIVIISTHILEEVSAVCSRALVIAKGKIVADGKPSELEAMSRYCHAITLELDARCGETGVAAGDAESSREDAVNQAKSALSALPCVSDIELSETNPQALTLIAAGGENIVAPVMACIQKHSWQIRDFHVERGRLDEVFRRITQEVA